MIENKRADRLLMSHVYDSLLTLLNNKPPAITFLCSDNTFNCCNMPWGDWFLKSIIHNFFGYWLFIILNQFLFLLLTTEKNEFSGAIWFFHTWDIAVWIIYKNLFYNPYKYKTLSRFSDYPRTTSGVRIEDRQFSSIVTFQRRWPNMKTVVISMNITGNVTYVRMHPKLAPAIF